MCIKCEMKKGLLAAMGQVPQDLLDDYKAARKAQEQLEEEANDFMKAQIEKAAAEGKDPQDVEVAKEIQEICSAAYEDKLPKCWEYVAKVQEDIFKAVGVNIEDYEDGDVGVNFNEGTLMYQTIVPKVGKGVH